VQLRLQLVAIASTPQPKPDKNSIMPIDRRWTWIHTTVVAALLGGVLLVAAAGKWGPWLNWERSAPHRPATAYNLVLTIDSNLIRAQVAMENLVFAKRPAELASQVKAVDLLTKAIEHDFQGMAEFFKADSAQLNQALSLFQKWIAIRDEIIRLTARGPSPRAQEMVLGQSASRIQEIRAALVKLERFSKKQGVDFDSKTYKTYRQEERDQ
jgi:hypothetical protein